MLVVKVEDLNNIKVEPEEVHPMYSPVSYNAGYNQALKDIKEAYNGLTVYDFPEIVEPVEDDKDPFDHTDEPFLCKAEGCSLYGCKHCARYEPDYDNPREGFV